jgi:hypothetical protein
MDGEQLSSRHFSYLEIIETQCSRYLEMGMPWNDFWDGDPDMYPHYRKAFKAKRDYEYTMLWLQGRYTYEAHARALADSLRGEGYAPVGYLEEPFPRTEKEAKEQKARCEREAYERNMAIFKAQVEAVNANMRAKRKDN